MRALARIGLVGLACSLALFAAACYRPEPVDGGFRCSRDLGTSCPGSLVCSAAGLCVLPSGLDMARAPLDLAGDQATSLAPRNCEERLRQGAFSNLVPLSTANTAADEGHLALDSTGAGRLLFQRAGQLYVAGFASSDHKTLEAPQLVTLTPALNSLHGGSFATDGKYWFSGTVAGTTSLYVATPAGGAAFTVGAARAPSTTGCAYTDPVFVENIATQSMFVGYELAGCGGASYVARGLAERNLGAFYSALVDKGWTTPSLSPSGLSLIVQSSVGTPALYAAQRSDFQFQFTSAVRIPMASIGEPIEDHQLVVSADCRTAYFASVRTGGVGGVDLYAADIAAE